MLALVIASFIYCMFGAILDRTAVVITGFFFIVVFTLTAVIGVAVTSNASWANYQNECKTAGGNHAIEGHKEMPNECWNTDTSKRIFSKEELANNLK